MKLDKIEITNFRCFETLVVPLHPRVNVFVGINGAGKSAILDAIAIGLYDVVAAASGGGKRARRNQAANLRPSDIHIPFGAKDPLAERKEFVQVSSTAKDFYPLQEFPASNAEGRLNTIEWTDFIQYRPPNDFDYDTSYSSKLARLYQYFAALWSEIKKSDAKALIPLPVVAYYRSQRRLPSMPLISGAGSVPRIGAFTSALNAVSSYDAMCRWFYLRENAELRERVQLRKDFDYEFPDLGAIRRAISGTLESVIRVFYEDDPPTLKVELAKSGRTPKVLSIDQLSDGYRNMLALILDFARRLAQANPHWPNPLEAPGILLIDEIELHLHPGWQQRIIPDLLKVFPNTQIIATTHSPQVITTVESQSVQIVDEGGLRPCPAPTFGARSSDVIEEVMGLKSLRPPENPIAKEITALFAAIDGGDLTEATRLRTELAKWAKGFPEPDLVRADLLMRRLEAKPAKKAGSQ